MGVKPEELPPTRLFLLCSALTLMNDLHVLGPVSHELDAAVAGNNPETPLRSAHLKQLVLEDTF